MTLIKYETPDGVGEYRCDDYHTDKDGLIVALKHGKHGGVEYKRTFPISRVIYVEE